MITKVLKDKWIKRLQTLTPKSFNIKLNDPQNTALLLYLPIPPLGQDMTQGQFFKQSLTGLKSEFSFS